MDRETIEHLRALEESLWISATRFDDATMDALFADDVMEFGRSGRIYGREALFLGDSAVEQIDATLPLPNFSARALSEDIVQITYISEVRYSTAIERANRSSLWRRGEAGEWRLCFHQGTPVA